MPAKHQVDKISVEPAFKFACECGRSFNLKQKNLGKELMCPACDRRFLIPADLQPIRSGLSTGQAISSTTESLEGPQRRWTIEWKYLGSGILLTLAGLAGVWALWQSFNLWGAIIVAVALLMGVATIIKGMFGDLIEWD